MPFGLCAHKLIARKTKLIRRIIKCFKLYTQYLDTPIWTRNRNFRDRNIYIFKLYLPLKSQSDDENKWRYTVCHINTDCKHWDTPKYHNLPLTCYQYDFTFFLSHLIKPIVVPWSAIFQILLTERSKIFTLFNIL